MFELICLLATSIIEGGSDKKVQAVNCKNSHLKDQFYSFL